MEVQDDKLGVCPEDGYQQSKPTEEPRRIRGFRRRFSESARDSHVESMSRLARFGTGLRRRLSGSTRDLFSSSATTAAAGGVEEAKAGNNGALRRHLSASMKDLLHGGGVQRGDSDAEGIGRRLSRRLSLLAGTVASRADHSRGSLRVRLPNFRRSRTFSVNIILPDSTSRMVVGDGTQTVGQAVSHVAQDLNLTTFSLALADSQAEVDLDASAYLLDGDTILLHDAIDTFNPAVELEPRLRMAIVIAATEKTLVRRLRCVEAVYGQHLRRLSSVTEDEHEILFGGVAPILTQAEALISRVEGAIDCWDAETSCLGPLFTAELWEQYEEYLSQYQEAVRILREKHSTDEEFVALCKLRRGAARHSLLHLLHLPVSRDCSWVFLFYHEMEVVVSLNMGSRDMLNIQQEVEN
ncbi:uncharacterized protein LOC122261464 [Penaeus japonicus]|uniref:uncharacterized protein LOC122261464 n=1 Tax=Penaeus japonicus TaxID=27405 RepID=UPI001C713510|nr:uncharacterized protein LOC122261464 [Penaeus japonicus]